MEDGRLAHVSAEVVEELGSVQRKVHGVPGREEGRDVLEGGGVV
jgi:hypothetical protein